VGVGRGEIWQFRVPISFLLFAVSCQLMKPFFFFSISPSASSVTSRELLGRK
jgi:hypothetical protein